MAEVLPTLSNTQGRYYRFALLAWTLICVLAFFSTFATMVNTWIVAETYTHGFLIVPISAWLLWDGRHRYLNLPIKPCLLPLVLLFGASLLWFLGTLAGVQVVQQLAAVSAFIVGVWLILGYQIAWRIAFALAFLLFAVPMGQGLVPPMIDLTADATVWLIKLTGIPIYREGTFFSLPTGNWSVVAACSGVRYLIASVTLGCLYAYITYRSLKKRLAFVALSIVVPVIANVFRAFLIVMIGHFSNMELATGVDHLIYGWIFFGVVMLVLFSLGARWRDDMTDKPAAVEKLPDNGADTRTRSLPIVGGLMLVCVLAAPLTIKAMDQRALPEQLVPLALPSRINAWHQVDIPFSWQPYTVGSHEQLYQAFSDSETEVAVYVDYFLYQQEGAEVIDRRSRIVEPGRKTPWRKTADLGLQRANSEPSFVVNTYVLTDDNQRLLVWGWFRVGDSATPSPYMAKIQDIKSRLLVGRRDAAKLFVATVIPNEDQGQRHAEQKLQAFAEQVLPQVMHAIDAVSGWDSDAQ
ncbi:MAG: exosortase A [Gammaproteobacteria bacterium]|nr:MAG: exosortase A [Gammaproteobacteria bacterium]